MQETWVLSLGWKIPWRRERLPTPVLWPGEFRGLYGPWGRKESDMTSTSFTLFLLLLHWLHLRSSGIRSQGLGTSGLDRVGGSGKNGFGETDTTVKA